jgi:hypothetical protein
MNLEKLKIKNLPNPIPFRKLLGPSFILLGLGLGSGEIIMWPYLSSKYGMGIIWGAIIGITFQFFINMEIERYTLARGESVFVGLTRKMNFFAPIWFLISTIIPWMWPGIIATSAKIFAHLFGINYSPIIPTLLLLSIGSILTLGPVVYKTQETLLRFLIAISVPTIVFITFALTKPENITDLALGIFGKGDGFWFLPKGISIAAFLGALAYAGAGGNLNLAQSFYIKEKGYGMGKFSGRITSILTGKKEDIKITGFKFPMNKTNIKKFNIWWKNVNLEHLIVFWATGAFTMVLLSFLSYITLYKSGIDLKGVEFIIKEKEVLSSLIFPFAGTLFLSLCAVMLYFTQFSVLDATSRITSENLLILSNKNASSLPRFYYGFLWLQILLGIAIINFGLNEPFLLLVISSVLNAFTMAIYTMLILFLNNNQLEKPIRPSALRKVAISTASLFYSVFSILTILEFIKGN